MSDDRTECFRKMVFRLNDGEERKKRRNKSHRKRQSGTHKYNTQNIFLNKKTNYGVLCYSDLKLKVK